MNHTEFNKWANEMIKRIDYKRIFTYKLPPENGEVVICYDKRTGKTGVARCHPKDRFNFVWGKAIATAHCLGIEVPKISEYKKVTDMKNGEIFNDGMEIFRFIGECEDYGGYKGFAVQSVKSNAIIILNKSSYSSIKFEMVE